MTPIMTINKTYIVISSEFYSLTVAFSDASTGKKVRITDLEI